MNSSAFCWIADQADIFIQQVGEENVFNWPASDRIEFLLCRLWFAGEKQSVDSKWATVDMPGKKVETVSAALWTAVGSVSNMLTWTVLADILQEQNKKALWIHTQRLQEQNKKALWIHTQRLRLLVDFTLSMPKKGVQCVTDDCCKWEDYHKWSYTTSKAIENENNET